MQKEELKAPDQAKLTRVFRAAMAAALEHKDTEDGGTCNFDAAVFPLNRMKPEMVLAAAKDANVSVAISTWSLMGRGRQYVFLQGMYGQGNRHTRMAEAACKVLEAEGIPGATMYYQMD